MLKARKTSIGIKIVSIIFMLTILTSMGMMTVSAAGNWRDTLEEFQETSPYSVGDMTAIRAKEDYTSSYMYNQKSSVPFTQVKVYGCLLWNFDMDYMCDQTYGTPKSLLIGEAKFLPNKVRENYADKCCLDILHNRQAAYIYAWWSPDSIPM